MNTSRERGDQLISELAELSKDFLKETNPESKGKIAFQARKTRERARHPMNGPVSEELIAAIVDKELIRAIRSLPAPTFELRS